MNRIYQGGMAVVEIRGRKDDHDKPVWGTIDNEPSAARRFARWSERRLKRSSRSNAGQKHDNAYELGEYGRLIRLL